MCRIDCLHATFRESEAGAMQTRESRIPCGTQTLACSVDYARGSPEPSIISIHGGGPSSRRTTEYLGARFQAAGKSVIRFDHSGQGESSGDLLRSSLQTRLSEALCVCAYFGLSDHTTVIGTSMGGHVASALVREIPVDSLILFCPAAYSVRAWDVEFGGGFTGIIRSPESYRETNIRELLGEFAGTSLLVTGAADTIIPAEVTRLYHVALSGCKRFDTHVIPDCPHPIHRWVLNREEIRRELEDRVLKFRLTDWP